MCLVRNTAKYFLLILLFAYASISHGLGFGALKVYSYLGEPLYAEIELTNTKDLDPNLLRVGLADAKDFVRAGIDRPFFLTNLLFQIMPYNDNLYIIIRTSKVVTSPYLEFLIELSWPEGNLIKEYTILLDPPPADLKSETRPKGYAQLAEEAATANNANVSSVEAQLNLQKAKAQKEAAEATLTNVVQEGANKFSDTTFDIIPPKTPLMPGVVPEVLEEEQAAKAGQDAYEAQLQTFKQQQQQKAAQQPKKAPVTLLQNVVSDLETVKSNIEPKISVEQILAEEHKTPEQSKPQEAPVNFNQAIPPTGAAPPTTATTMPPPPPPPAGTAATAPTTPTATPTTPAPIAGALPAQTGPRNIREPTPGAAAAAPIAAVLPEPVAPKSNHLYLGIILSLLLIAAGIGIAVKRGMLGGLLNRVHPSETEMPPEATHEEEEVPVSDKADETMLNAALEEFTTPEDTEHIDLSSTEDIEKFEQEFEKIDLDELGTPVDQTTQATKPPAPIEPTSNVATPTAETLSLAPTLETTTPPTATTETLSLAPTVESTTPPTPITEKLSLAPTLEAIPTAPISEPQAPTFPGPTLVKDEPSGLKLSEEGATLTTKEEGSTHLDNTEPLRIKIDLAKQYLATGDKESAKDLLREVIEVGNDEQKLEAQILLSGII